MWCIGPPLRQNLGKLLGPETRSSVEPAAQAYLRRYATKGVRETTEYPGIDAMLHRIRSSGARDLSSRRPNSSIMPKSC